MTLKISTEDAKNFVCDYYRLKGISSEPDDWELTKKYRNFKGVICRDFANAKNRVRAVVVAEEESQEFQQSPLKVIENENYEYFLKMVTNMPLFYYVPTICNDGLIFIFESASHFEQRGQLSPHPEQHHLLLKKKLATLFREEDMFALGNNLRFSFPDMEMEEVVRRLERNRLSFNSKIFACLDNRIYQPIMPDIAMASYFFPQDDKLDHDQAIETIFSIISKKEILSEEDYARIKSLLKKVSNEEFGTVKKIALGFKKNLDQRLFSIFDVESNRKKSQRIVKDIWLDKVRG